MDATLDECATNLAECYTNFQDQWPYNITVQCHDQIDAFSEEHRRCRHDQYQKWRILNYSRHLLDTKYDVKEKWCDLWKANESGSNAPGSECEVDLTLYAGTYWSIDY